MRVHVSPPRPRAAPQAEVRSQSYPVLREEPVSGRSHNFLPPGGHLAGERQRASETTCSILWGAGLGELLSYCSSFRGSRFDELLNDCSLLRGFGISDH